MATQSGVTLAALNAPFTVVDNIPRPVPGPGQVLAKTLTVAINPLESLQQYTGVLVTEWPVVPGCDGVGVVIELGPGCTKLKLGDVIFGCAPVGQSKSTSFQDTFVIDEKVFLRKPDNVTLEEASTIGVGLLTAALGLFAGAGLKLPDVGSRATEKDEWVVVLGGSGSVGQFAVQIAQLCGYKVLASCSPSRRSVPLNNGATETFNGRGSVDEQVADIQRITGGNFARIIDTTTFGFDVMAKALETVSTAEAKYLASVDDWSEFKIPPGVKEYRISIGHLCRPDEVLGAEVTRLIALWVSELEAHLAAGTLRPLEYQLVNVAGWEGVISGIQDLQAGRAAKKVVVKIQDS